MRITDSADRSGDRVPVGIEALAVYLPRHAIDLGALAAANGVEPSKYYKGLGGMKMAVVSPDEDPVTMAVSAAERLIAAYDVDPADIGLLIVGSESGVDCAKPIAAYVQGLLRLPAECRVFDTVHACYSATAALRLAADWCSLRHRENKKALVIASDVARYEVGSPGEPTQGAGAVALLVGCSPSVLKIDAQWEALFSREVMDFWRPHYRHNALVNGQVSVTSYMEALRRTYGTHKVMSGFGWDDYDYMLFHVPFPKMAVKGLRALYDLEVESGAIEKARTFDGEFAARTDPALWANREVGNVYSGSLYLSLGALLEGGESCLADARIGLYSYGSGCCAEYFSGTLGGDPAAWRGKTGLVDCLKRRVELDHAQYIKMRREGERLLGEGSFNARRTTVSAPGHDPMKGVSFRGIRDHQRVYERTDPMVGQHARNTCAPAPRLIFNDAYGVAGAVCVP